MSIAAEKLPLPRRFFPKPVAMNFSKSYRNRAAMDNSDIYIYSCFFILKLIFYYLDVTSNRTKDGALIQCCGCFSYRTEYEPYTGDSYTLVRDHPLFIVSESNSQLLMEHPFCQALRSKKYSQFGRYLLIFSFILYLLYLIAYTAYYVTC